MSERENGCVTNFDHGEQRLTIWKHGDRFTLSEFGVFGARLPLTDDLLFQSIAREVHRLAREVGRLRRQAIERERETGGIPQPLPGGNDRAAQQSPFDEPPGTHRGGGPALIGARDERLPVAGTGGPFPVEPSGPRWVAVEGGTATCPNGQPHICHTEEPICRRCDARLRWEAGQ